MTGTVDPVYQVVTSQLHSDLAMNWGAFCWKFWEFLVLVLILLNAIRYVELLGDHLNPFKSSCHPHGNRAFLKDNFSSNRFRTVTAWLDEQSFDFSATNWLPRSPDLNLINTSGMFWRKMFKYVTQSQRLMDNNSRYFASYACRTLP